MLSRFKEELFFGIALIFGVLPGFFLTILAIGLLGHGIGNFDIGLIAFGTGAVFGYVGGIVAIFSSHEFRTRHSAWIVLLVSVGIVTLVTSIPTVLSISAYQGRIWPAALVFSTLLCAVSILVRQWGSFVTPKSER